MCPPPLTLEAHFPFGAPKSAGCPCLEPGCGPSTPGGSQLPVASVPGSMLSPDLHRHTHGMVHSTHKIIKEINLKQISTKGR